MSSRKKKKVLVTGSGGFVFGNFIRRAFYLQKQGNQKRFNIASLDRVRDSYILHNIYVNKDHEFYIADVRDPHMLRVIFQVEQPDVVIHGADESNDVESMVSSNIVGTKNMIDASVENEVSQFVFISTESVYGKQESESEDSWSEHDPVNPLNTYSASKAAAELLVRSAGEEKGLQYQIVRLCNAYGPWQSPAEFIPRVIKSITEGVSFKMPGQGEHVRDWMHVWDVCDALMTIIDNGEMNQTYNVSTTLQYKNIEVFQLICNIFNSGHELVEFVHDDTTHYRYSMSNDKLSNLGWKPTMKLKEGLEQACQWYVNNRHFLSQ